MKAEIITIGDEILIGQIVDTNSAWIAERLNEVGIRVTSRISVGDEDAAIKDAVSDAMNSADVIIMTGGLGPTKDDITKKTLAELFGCGMVRDEATYRRNGDMMTARGIEYNELNRSQSMVPECCKVIFNPNGTAPGMWFDRGGKVLVSLPGVPFEMKHLMSAEVLPMLGERFALEPITHLTMVTFGIPEAVLAETIAAWEDALPEYMHLAYLPSPSGIRLRLSAYEEHGGARAQMQSKFAELEKIIPGSVVGYGDVSVQSEVARILTERGQTMAAAESCTGGAVSAAFTAMPGATAYFLGGVVSYSNQVKVNVLGVDPHDLEREGAVSRIVAEQMAVGARRITGADYAVSTTGVAGPDGGTDEKPVGTIWIAAAHPGGVKSQKLVCGKLRSVNIERATSTAINMLRQMLSAESAEVGGRMSVQAG